MRGVLDHARPDLLVCLLLYFVQISEAFKYMTIQYFIERRASSVTLFVFCCNHKLIAVKSNILLPSTTKPSQNMFQLQLAAASLNCKGGNPVCASMYSSPQKNMDSGYPLDWFVQKVPEKFICEICGKVLQSPRATPCCSNMFCLHCLEFWIEYYGVCPKRCAEIEADTLQKVIGIEKTIQTLQVYCKYSSNGCKAKMAIEEKLKHEKKCPNKQDEQTNLEEIETIQRKTSTQSSQDTYVEMASVACRNKTSVGDHDSESRVNLHPIFTGDLVSHLRNCVNRSPVIFFLLSKLLSIIVFDLNATGTIRLQYFLSLFLHYYVC